MIKAPIIELHISNPHKREPFRHHSYVTFAATALICGLGVNGYPLAVDAMADLIKAKQAQIMSGYQDISWSSANAAILWITINRPAALNALIPLGHRELSAALDLRRRAGLARRGDHRRGRARVLCRQRPQVARRHAMRTIIRRPASAASRTASI